jgi:hypothetical protein
MKTIVGFDLHFEEVVIRIGAKICWGISGYPDIPK